RIGSSSLRALENRLEETGAFDSIAFVDKDEALREFRRDYGEEMTRALEVNPLPHSYRAYPKDAPLSGARLAAIREELLAMPGVEEVSGNFTQLAWLDRWRGP